jgi:hypothetical protein
MNGTASCSCEFDSAVRFQMQNLVGLPKVSKNFKGDFRW